MNQEQAPQPKPQDTEQLVLDLGNQQVDEQVSVYDWAQEGNNDNVTNETLTDHDVNAGRVAFHGIKHAIQERRANRQAKIAPKASADSKAVMQAQSANARIAQLDDELSGASSTIAAMKDGVYTPVRSMRSYKLDEQGKKRLMTNKQKLDYEQKVEELNTLRGYTPAALTEVEPAKVEVIDDKFAAYLDTLSPNDEHAIQQLISGDTKLAEKFNNMTNQERKEFIENYIQGELNANVITTDPVSHTMNVEKLPNYITKEIYNEFIGGLSSDVHDWFVELPVSEQHQWIMDWYKTNKGPKVIVHPAGSTLAQAKKTFDYDGIGAKRTFAKTAKPHAHKKKFMTRVLDRASARIDKIVDALDGNTLGKKPAKIEKAEDRGIVKRSALATGRGADRALDFLATRAGQYSIQKDKR